MAKSADAFRADLIVLDYLQRILPPGEHGDKRGAVNATMDHLRRFAENEIALIVVAAVGRTKDKPGRSSYDADGLNLASFRESSELEFGADDAFILAPDAKDAGRVTLKHLKARHGETRDIVLTFDKPCQRFTEAEDPSLWKPEAEPAGKEPAGKLQKALQTLWDRTPAAGDDDQGRDDFR